MNNDVKKLIDVLNLERHFEGGYFNRTYQSTHAIHIGDKEKPITTAIYYLLESDDFSAWHRLQSDEMWHYYAGSNLIIHQIDADGQLTSFILGNLLMKSNARPQHRITAGTWFAAETESPMSFTLIGCTVSPGFMFEDFELGKTDELIKTFPQHEKIIRKFSRN